MESSDQNPQKPQRRIRYKGTHPRHFQEKYKEQNPEKYAADVEKVLARGQTPAGMHRSIMVAEVLDFLQPQPGQTGLDATLGWGGHAQEMVRRVQPGGRLFATDVDSSELPKTEKRLRDLGFGEDTLFIRQMNFSGIDKIANEAGLLHFVLADLGVSSMQIDNPERGFSYKVEGPLDLRLNPAKGKPASEVLKSLSQPDFEALLNENADEPYAVVISKTVTAAIERGQKVETTAQLRDLIEQALTILTVKLRKEETKKACQRCFQALRIEVNNEFDMLDRFLEKLPHALAPGGRVAILSFHSGEDRRVKKSFQAFFREGVYKEIAPDPVRPSAQECVQNPRAKSAKMRWAVRSIEG